MNMNMLEKAFTHPLNSYSTTLFSRAAIEQSIGARFEQQVDRYPDRLAIANADLSLTYDELNRLTNRIARTILAVQPDKQPRQVAIYLEKGIQYIAAILGTLKAGHAYVPIDPSFPESRNNYIMADSGASLALTNTVNAGQARKLAPDPIELINLDEIDESLNDSNLNLDISPDTLAYIIYTSGSTGKPKGVMQNHRNTLHGCMRRTNLQKITSEDRMTLFYSCSVMGSVYCIFGSLLNGASLFPYDIREEGLDELAAWLRESRITIYHSVASVFRQFAAGYSGSGEEFNVRLVIFGGERVLATDVDLARKVFSPKVHFFTGLGSTETGTVRHLLITPETRIDNRVVPIGYPVEDVDVVLTDDEGRRIPPGKIGEITIRSKYLALGYWNDPENTARVFGRCTENPEVRIYFMGDMGELHPDGLLEHRGRKDFQVKIRGFRVEIGEIETALMDHHAVDEAVVVARDIGLETQLVAYLVKSPNIGASQDWHVRALRSYLQEKLPYYMVPSVFVALNEIPRTPNNKIDRNALPKPSPTNELIDDECIAPTNEIERCLVDICNELLHRPQMGINHNFFDYGGDSLKATRLISRVNDRFSVRLTMRAVFEAKDLRDLAARVQSAAPRAATRDKAELIAVPRDGRLPVSFAQRRMWLVDQLHGGSSAYNISNSARLKGALNIAALEKALSAMVARHEILRTVFPSDENGPWQQVNPPTPVVLHQADLRGLAAHQRLPKAVELAVKSLRKAHDLAKGPLFSTSLIRLDQEDFVLVLVFNHIIYDNIWSSGIFFRELGTLYDAGLCKQPLASALPPLQFQFADYAHWEARRIEQGGLEDVVNYWKQQLANLPEPLQLPSDRVRPEQPTFRGGQVRMRIPASLRMALSYFARNETATLFMVLLAAWQLLLHRYTQQDDILIGTPTGRRYRTETEGLLGLFINNLVIRTNFSGNPSFRELLRRVRQVTIEAFSHDELPFEILVQELRPERATGVSPFFQHLFIHRNATDTEWHLPGLELTPLEIHPGGSKFDLSLSVLENNRELSATLEYASDLFDHDTIERMAANYIQLLTSAVEQPDCTVWQLEIIAETERQLLLEEWNRTERPYPATTSTHELFEMQVAENPDAVAVISDAGNMSYRQLNERANQLAAHLISMGVEPNKGVAVCLNRSADLIVTLLAVLKSGGAYVSLDPFFPADRLAYMIEDSQVSVLISQQAVVDKLPALRAQTLLLDSSSEIFSSGKKQNPISRGQPEDTAYIIYTSGSTGKPKGVPIKQHSLVNFLCAMQKEPGISRDDIVLSLATICFDIAALEFFLPLISGARVVIKPREAALTPENLIENIETYNVTFLQATPVTWRMLFNHGWSGKRALKALSGAEALGEDLAEKFLASGVDLWNLYGPTETTVWASVCHVRSKKDVCYIGHPITNVEFLVCSPKLTLQPIGVPGELLIGGEGVATGYFNREELNREKFIEHPFKKGKRVYRTGDLVVRRTNGNIAFLGRMDFQVKIRGFRIELGDIESHILNSPDIAEAVVVAREDSPGDKVLVAYVVPKNGVDIDPLKLSSRLRKELPDYMVPSAFVTLLSLPLTPTNKIDRKSLPAPSKPAISVVDTLPSTDATAARLIEIFEQVLGGPVTSLQTSFFDLGGHSLSALTAVALINRQFSINLPQSTLFDLQTIEQLSKAVIELRRGTAQPDELKIPALSRKDAEKVDRIIGALWSVPDLSQERVNPCPKMRESWICKNLVAPMFPRCRRSIQRVLKKIILKLEGGSAFTVTLRKLFKKCYDIEIGDFTSVYFDVDHLRRTTRIGRYCSIFRTSLIQNADHPRNTLSTHAIFYHKKYAFTDGYKLERMQVEIGNDVWIGADAKILYPTRKIGDGAVIASGAVVVGDVPPYAIVGGYPAQVVRYRFSKETIAKLMEVKWWEHSLEELQSIREEFMKPVEGDRIR